MTKHDEYDFSQFKGSFDSAMSPDSDFTERMKQMLEKESGAGERERKTTVLASPSRPNKEVPIPGRRTHPLTIAASILVVLAVVVSSIWVLSGSPLEGEYGSAPSGIATLPADAEVTPGPDVALNAELVIPIDTRTYANRYTLDVIDGVVYTTHNGPSSKHSQDISVSFVTAWDAETGDKIWEIEDYSIGDLTVSDGVLVALRITFEDRDGAPAGARGTSSNSIVAIDTSTGDELWDYALSDDKSSWLWAQHFLVIDEQVVVLNPDGSAIAMDIHAGEETWESTYDRGRAWPTTYQQSESSVTVNMYTVVMVEKNDLITIANGDGRIQMVDPKTGDTTATHQIDLGSSSEGMSIGSLELRSVPQGLLILWPGEKSHISLLNSESGDIIWEREIDGQLNIDVSEDGMIAVNSHIWESGTLLERLLRRRGHSTHQFTWINGETGEEVLTTERGRADGPVFAKTNGEYLCTKAEEIVCYDRSGTKHTIQNVRWANVFFDDGNFYFDRDDGVYRVTLP